MVFSVINSGQSVYPYELFSVILQVFVTYSYIFTVVLCFHDTLCHVTLWLVQDLFKKPLLQVNKKSLGKCDCKMC